MKKRRRKKIKEMNKGKEERAMGYEKVG